MDRRIELEDAGCRILIFSTKGTGESSYSRLKLKSVGASLVQRMVGSASRATLESPS
jgi:hypothetical protein